MTDRIPAGKPGSLRHLIGRTFLNASSNQLADVGLGGSIAAAACMVAAFVFTPWLIVATALALAPAMICWAEFPQRVMAETRQRIGISWQPRAIREKAETQVANAQNQHGELNGRIFASLFVDSAARRPEQQLD